MAWNYDPRGDLPQSIIQPTSYYSHRRGIVSGVPIKKPKKKQCHDWIFSSASNVHVALDQATFKAYIPFKSYVLTVADQRQVSVRGIGTVEIKIRREAGSKESHTVCLENVLHIPEWMCNIVSDVCFTPASNYQHTWTEFGVNFFERDKGLFRPWGYTENFCGLDRLILARNLHGRSPMLEDPDREVFSVSLTWPQSQQDKWSTLITTEQDQGTESIFKKKKSPDDEFKTMKREAKSSLIETAKWKLMPDVRASMKTKSSGDLRQSKSKPEFLPRRSSLMFESQ